MANTMAHDPAGWRAICRHCNHLIWCAWSSAKARPARMELDEVTPHQCVQVEVTA